MPQFECKKDSRVHWHFVPITDSLREKYKDYKSADLEKVFIEFAKKSELIKQYFMRKQGIKLTVCKYKKLVVLTSCVKNEMDTYQGQFYISDDKDAEKDLLAIAKCYKNGVSKIEHKIIGGVLKDKGMN